MVKYFRAGSERWWITIGLILFVSTAAYNIGWVALDDYETSIAPILPAQKNTFAGSNLLHTDSIRSPVAGFTLLAIAKGAYRLGISHPVTQFRFVLVVWSLFSFLMLTYFGRAIFAKDETDKNLFSFLLGLYFLSPVFLTRPMIESLAAPFLLAGAFFACRYSARPQFRDLFGACLFLTLSTLYRFQVGLCVPVLLLLPLIKKRGKDFAGTLATLIGLFLITGFLDQILKGSFHATIRSYVAFNLAYNATFGATPFYTFPVMLVALSLPPVFISRYRGFKWKKEYAEPWPALLMLFLFVLGHSIAAHKEERFMIPILPLYLVALVPLAKHFLREAAYWRVWFFLNLNIPLLFLASFSIIQNNVVSLSQYFDRHPQITQGIFVEDSVALFPQVYVSGPFGYTIMGAADWQKSLPKNCQLAYAIRRDFRDRLGVPADRVLVKEFSPGPLEKIVVSLNRRHNNRRDSIFVYVPKGCPNDF